MAGPFDHLKSDPSRLTHRVRLQQRGTAQDVLGQVIETWSDVDTVWADVRYLRGLELIKSGAQTAKNTVSIRILNRAGVTTGMRAVEGSTVFAINAVHPQPSNELHLVCEVLS